MILGVQKLCNYYCILVFLWIIEFKFISYQILGIASLSFRKIKQMRSAFSWRLVFFFFLITKRGILIHVLGHNPVGSMEYVL